MGRYKLIREQDSPNQDWQLFDLQTDASESTDLRPAKPELANRLKAEYERWTAEATSARQVTEQGLTDSKAGRTAAVEEVRRRYGLLP